MQKEDIDGAEEPSMLTEHISRIIRNRLKDENLTTEERASFVNRVNRFSLEKMMMRSWQTTSRCSRLLCRFKKSLG